MVLVETVRIIPITTVIRTAGWFHIGYVPRFRSDGAQEGSRIHRACAFFCVVSFSEYAALLGPELLEC